MEWRSIGPVPYERWLSILRNVGSPIVTEGEAAWRAAGEHSALCLAQCLIESRAGTDGRLISAKNPLGLRPRPGDLGAVVPGPFRVFTTWTEAIAYWYSKITDPGYAYAATTTLEEYVHVYAPSSDGNDERAYVQAIRTYLQLWGIQPMTTVTFGNVPHPAFQVRDIPDSRAWDDLGPRVIRGVTWHRMQGTLWGTDSYFRGEALSRALTDYGIGVAHVDGPAADGLILRWNDPRGRRAPWASGPYQRNGAYGDGAKFVAAHGVNAINRDRVSIEIAGYFPFGPVTQNTPLTEASRAALAALTAYWADQAKIPWTSFPMVPGQNYSFVAWHDEFCGTAYKPCPGPVVKEETDALIERVRTILKTYQEKTMSEPKAETGIPVDVLKWLFGRVRVNGRIYTYSPTGQVSALWKATCERQGRWQRLREVQETRINGKQVRIFLFEGGLAIAHREGEPPDVL